MIFFRPRPPVPATAAAATITGRDGSRSGGADSEGNKFGGLVKLGTKQRGGKSTEEGSAGSTWKRFECESAGETSHVVEERREEEEGSF